MQQSPVILDLCLKTTRSGKSRDCREAIDRFFFEKLCFKNVFRPHENENLSFSNSSSLRSVFEKLRFLEGLVWTVGHTADFSGIMWRLP